jgi:phospholipid transport system substrate-binding protein
MAVVLPSLLRAESVDDALQFVEVLAQRAIATVTDKQLSQIERDERFRRLFVASFDVPEIGRFVLSRYWRNASSEQQQEFVALFEDIVILTWNKRFQGYSGERLEALGASRDGDRGWVVDSRIVKVQGPPIAVQWHLRQGGDGSFRVVDVIVEGVSMAITLRSDYTGALQANGGRVDSLLSTLRAKLEQLRAAG